MSVLPDWPALAGLIARMRSLGRAWRRRDVVDAEMAEEFRVHMALRAEDLHRSGVAREEAERRARLEFGHVASHRADARAARGLHLFDQARFSWIDVTLGLRMLRKYPVLSVAAVFALAVGIPIGLAPGHAARALEAPLPGDPEHRIRAIRLWDPVTSSVAATTHADFERWSRELGSYSRLAAFSTAAYNVGFDDGGAAPVAGAQVSTALFSLVRSTPKLGRALVDADGERGASAVVVIGHDLWMARLGGDPGVIGRSIRIGRGTHTIVGVMPEGFRFPATEQLWLPLPPTLADGTGGARSVRVVARLADSVSPEQAQAELDATARFARPEIAAARARLLPEVVPFGLQYMGLPRGGLDALPEFRFVQLLALALLLVACGNVAMLVYARTATRAREMALRTALGASRARIVTQVFVETMVLATVAAIGGVAAIDWLLGRVNVAAIAGETTLPYWLSLGVTGRTLLQAVALAVLSATVAGVAPAIRITGRWVQPSLRGPTRTRFGGWINALVIADIAVAVAVVGLALAMGRHANVLMASDRATGVRAAEVLAAELRLPDAAVAPAPSSAPDRAAATQRAFVAAIAREPGIRGVAIAEALPRMEHRMRPMEIEGVELPPDTPPRWVRSVRVDAGYLAGLGQRVLSGRDFTAADADGTRGVIIVNSAFVTRLLDGGDPIGRRVRFATSAGVGDTAWHQIIGVVGHLGVNMMNPERGEAVYLPAAPGRISPLQVGIRTAGNPALLVPRLREIATAVDPELIIGRATVLSDVRQGDWYLMVAIAGGLALLVVILVVLATSGLYAMLSLSVSERTREIGIRSALGGQRRTLVLTILRRSLLQIGVGGLIGLPVAFRFVNELTEGGEGGVTTLDAALFAVGVASGIVLVVGLSACLVPARRVLAIEATQAMKGEE